MKWTKQELAKAWCQGAFGGIGRHKVIEICETNGWKCSEINGMRKRLIDERGQFRSQS